MKRIYILIFSIIFISSCGGGGSGGGNTNNSNTTPSITLSASSTSVPHFTFTNINWSSKNTRNCSALPADGFYWPEIAGNSAWTTKTTTTGTESVQIPFGTTTFTMSCETNTGSSITESITINGYQSFNMASIVDFYDIYETYGEAYLPTEFNGYMFIVNSEYNAIAVDSFADAIGSFMCVYQIRLNVTYQDINTAVISDFKIVQTADIQLLLRPDTSLPDFYQTNFSPEYYNNNFSNNVVDVSINNSNSILTTNSIDIDFYDYISSISQPEDYDIDTTGTLSIEFSDSAIEVDPCLVDINEAKLFMTPNPEIIDNDAAMVGWQNHDLGFTVLYLESEYYSENYHRFNSYWSYYEGLKFTIDDNLNLSLDRIDFNLGTFNKDFTAGSILNYQANFGSEINLPFDLSFASPIDKEDFNGNVLNVNDYALKRLYNDCLPDYTSCSYGFFKPNIALMMNPKDECFSLSEFCNTSSPYQIFFSLDESDEIFAFDIIGDGYNSPITSISEMRLWIGY